MDLSSSAMIPFLSHSSINTGHPACLSFTFQICALSVVFSASPRALHCGKVDFHHSYCESVHSSCPCLLHHFQSLFKACWSSLQASMLDDISSHGQPFFFGVSSCHIEFLSAPKFSVSRQVSQYLATTPEFSVVIPYCDEPPIVVFHRVDLLLHQNFPSHLTTASVDSCG
jgi:hypothetical protein